MDLLHVATTVGALLGVALIAVLAVIPTVLDLPAEASHLATAPGRC